MSMNMYMYAFCPFSLGRRYRVVFFFQKERKPLSSELIESAFQPTPDFRLIAP